MRHGIEFPGEHFGTVIVTIAIHGVAVIVSIVVIAVAIRGVVIVIVAPKTFQRVHQVQKHSKRFPAAKLRPSSRPARGATS